MTWKLKIQTCQIKKHPIRLCSPHPSWNKFAFFQSENIQNDSTKCSINKKNHKLAFLAMHFLLGNSQLVKLNKKLLLWIWGVIPKTATAQKLFNMLFCGFFLKNRNLTICIIEPKLNNCPKSQLSKINWWNENWPKYLLHII